MIFYGLMFIEIFVTAFCKQQQNLLPQFQLQIVFNIYSIKYSHIFFI